jgi:pimeloyl-ACP methyl ester carboxylesterase
VLYRRKLQATGSYVSREHHTHCLQCSIKTLTKGQNLSCSGFYNNFLASLPDVKKHLEPLLAEDQPPRKLYVVGHSLGGGVATLAACYFLLEFDWTKLPHSFVGVTAGAPRSCCTSMKTFIDERAKEMEGSARMFRLVKDRDVVVKLPPTFLGFTHLGPAVVIEEDGTIHVREVDFLDTDGDVEEATLRGLSISPEEGDEEEKDVPESTKYIRMLGRIPKSLRDHMPEL